MSKATPGPWSVTTNAHTGRVYVANLGMPRGTGMVAEMLACESLEHVPGNARLIAAAPALLAAAEESVALIEAEFGEMGPAVVQRVAELLCVAIDRALWDGEEPDTTYDAPPDEPDTLAEEPPGFELRRTPTPQREG